MFFSNKSYFYPFLKISSVYLEYNCANTPLPPLDKVQIEEVLS